MIVNNFTPAISSYENTSRVVKLRSNDSELRIVKNMNSQNSVRKIEKKLVKSDVIDRSLKLKSQVAMRKLEGGRNLKFSTELEKENRKLLGSRSMKYASGINSNRVEKIDSYQAQKIDFQNKRNLSSSNVAQNLNFQLNQSVKNKSALINMSKSMTAPV
jgi:hypothetical protein